MNVLYLIVQMLGYRFFIALSPKESDQVFKIRFNVYNNQGYLSPLDFPSQKFQDEYDLFSVNFIAQKNGKTVGSVRLIPSQKEKPLPTECEFNLPKEYIELIRNNVTGEVSKLVVTPEYRKKNRLNGRLTMFGLAFAMYNYSVKNKIEYWIMNLPEKLAKTYLELGVRLEQIPELPISGEHIEARRPIANYFNKFVLHPYFVKVNSIPNA